MPDKIELYDGEYGHYDSGVYRQVRTETYGVNFGQTSWVTNEESAQIPRMLELTSNSSVLEIGCGSGMYALHIAQTIGCSVTGIDINALGIRNANRLASNSDMARRVRFELCDVSNADRRETLAQASLPGAESMSLSPRQRNARCRDPQGNTKERQLHP
jgi:SAM-dependent methyltransferase